MPRPRNSARTFSTNDSEAPVSLARRAIDSSSVIFRAAMGLMYGESTCRQAGAHLLRRDDPLPKMPTHNARMSVPASRIRKENEAPVRHERAFVLYWMIAARRTRSNFGLE